MTQRVAGVIAADAGITLEGPEPPRPPPDERPANGPSAELILLGDSYCSDCPLRIVQSEVAEA